MYQYFSLMSNDHSFKFILLGVLEPKQHNFVNQENKYKSHKRPSGRR